MLDTIGRVLGHYPKWTKSTRMAPLLPESSGPDMSNQSETFVPSSTIKFIKRVKQNLAPMALCLEEASICLIFSSIFMPESTWA